MVDIYPISFSRGRGWDECHCGLARNLLIVILPARLLQEANSTASPDIVNVIVL
ncbi:MAG: hypothetical protein LBO69_03295 [Ignavibacteria bacterium]|nr:hypothetical protein [Ignavibacteria bacterium]